MHAHTTLSIHVQYLLLLCVHESLLPPPKEKFLDGTLLTIPCMEYLLHSLAESNMDLWRLHIALVM